jgi:hypothetical protein
MANPGLASGFCRFGTLAHKILLICHKQGTVSQVTLQARPWPDCVDPPQAISVNLLRLERGGFLHKCAKTRDHGHRLHHVYQIERPHHTSVLYVDQKLNGVERSRQWRARKKLLVPSVFEFRGRVAL